MDQLYRAALELDTVGVPYGELALSVAVGGWDRAELDQVGGLVQRVFTQADGKAVKERFGQTATWFGRFPGQRVQPLARPILVSSGQAAALAPLFGPARGCVRSEHLDRPALTQFETRWGTPYGYDLFGGGDVGHTLVLGAPVPCPVRAYGVGSGAGAGRPPSFGDGDDPQAEINGATRVGRTVCAEWMDCEWQATNVFVSKDDRSAQLWNGISASPG